MSLFERQHPCRNTRAGRFQGLIRWASMWVSLLGDILLNVVFVRQFVQPLVNPFVNGSVLLREPYPISVCGRSQFANCD